MLSTLQPMPTSDEPTPVLPGLSPVRGKAIIARFGGGQLCPDGGVLSRIRSIYTGQNGLRPWSASG